MAGLARCARVQPVPGGGEVFWRCPGCGKAFSDMGDDTFQTKFEISRAHLNECDEWRAPGAKPQMANY
eukprot:g41625.t1